MVGQAVLIKKKQKHKPLVLVKEIKISKTGVEVVLVPVYPIVLSRRKLTVLEDAMYRFGTLVRAGRSVKVFVVNIPPGLVESMKMDTRAIKTYAVSLVEKILRKVLSHV